MKNEQIASMLPEVFRRTLQQGAPLQAVLEVMEDLHAPAEAALARVERNFNPYTAPDAFVPMLACWLDLDRFFSPRALEGIPDQSSPSPLASGLGRLRELIAVAVELSHWRGTAYGLRRFLETATGLQGFKIDDNIDADGNAMAPYHFRVVAPAAAARHARLIERIIEQEKPAYVTYELEIEGVSDSAGRDEA